MYYCILSDTPTMSYKIDIHGLGSLIPEIENYMVSDNQLTVRVLGVLHCHTAIESAIQYLISATSLSILQLYPYCRYQIFHCKYDIKKYPTHNLALMW